MTGGHCDATGQQNINFFVPGTPAPQGSKRHIGRGVMIESCKQLRPWRERVALTAHNTTLVTPLLAGPVVLRLHFVMPRPKTTPKRSTPPAIKRPDLDKLARACLDAITNIIIKDDSQIIDLHATKRIAQPEETPGVHIQIKY